MGHPASMGGTTMILFVAAVAVLFMVCRVVQVRLDRYAASLQPDPALLAARQAAVRASREPS